MVSDRDRSRRSFLRFVTSLQSQRRFNRSNGSIVPQAGFDDADDDRHPFYRQQWREYYNSRMQPPSIAHGHAIALDIRGEIATALAAVPGRDDLDRATGEILAALSRATVL